MDKLFRSGKKSSKGSSITTECQSCKKNILLKDYDKHMAEHKRESKGTTSFADKLADKLKFKGMKKVIPGTSFKTAEKIQERPEKRSSSSATSEESRPTSRSSFVSTSNSEVIDLTGDDDSPPRSRHRSEESPVDVKPDVDDVVESDDEACLESVQGFLKQRTMKYIDLKRRNSELEKEIQQLREKMRIKSELQRDSETQTEEERTDDTDENQDRSQGKGRGEGESQNQDQDLRNVQQARVKCEHEESSGRSDDSNNSEEEQDSRSHSDDDESSDQVHIGGGVNFPKSSYEICLNDHQKRGGEFATGLLRLAYRNDLKVMSRMSFSPKEGETHWNEGIINAILEHTWSIKKFRRGNESKEANMQRIRNSLYKLPRTCKDKLEANINKMRRRRSKTLPPSDESDEEPDLSARVYNTRYRRETKQPDPRRPSSSNSTSSEEEKEEIALNLGDNDVDESGLGECDSGKRGRGIKSSIKYEIGQLVCIYRGTLVSDNDDVSAIMNEVELDEDNDVSKVFPFKFMGKQYCIDGREENSTIGRLINHKIVGNLEARVVVQHGLPGIGLFALDTIMPGQELFFNYNLKNAKGINWYNE